MSDLVKPPTLLKRFISGFRNSFLTGVVVIAPVGLTVWLVWTVIGWVDGFVLPFVPSQYQPEELLKAILGEDVRVNIRGLGVVFFLVFTTFIGWIAKGLLGRTFIRSAENLVNRMPVVRSVYSGVKQIAETVFAQADRSFEKACLIEYPRRGIWAIGFISTAAKGEVSKRAGSGQKMQSIFVQQRPTRLQAFCYSFPLRM